MSLNGSAPGSAARVLSLPSDPTVFVIDDDPAMRESLRWLLESVGLAVETYAAAEEYLSTYDAARPGCLVVDVRMPGMSGLDLQRELAGRKATTPIIIITGHADVPTAVRAFQAGAADFIEKPFSDQQLVDRIRLAVDADRKARVVQQQHSEAAARLARLTAREREVLNRVIAGKTNRAIGAELGVSPKTVEVHRSRLMKKLQVDSLAALIRLTTTVPDPADA